MYYSTVYTLSSFNTYVYTHTHHTHTHCTTQDFSLDPEIHRMHLAAHHMVRHLTAGMAMITCREALLMSISNNLKNAFAAAVRVSVYLTITQYSNFHSTLLLSLTLCTLSLSLCIYVYSPYVCMYNTHVYNLCFSMQSPPEELKTLIDQAAHQVSFYLCIVLSQLSIYLHCTYSMSIKKTAHKQSYLRRSNS